MDLCKHGMSHGAVPAPAQLLAMTCAVDRMKKKKTGGTLWQMVRDAQKHRKFTQFANTAFDSIDQNQDGTTHSYYVVH